MKKGCTLPDRRECGKPQDCPEKREEDKMHGEKRVIELLKVGCPKCKQKDRFLLDCTEEVRRIIRPDPEDPESIYYEDEHSEYIATVSYDLIICLNCLWGERLKE